MTSRENTLRAWRRQRPAWIPASGMFPAPCWAFYDPQELEDIHLSHPVVFPGYCRGSIYPDNLPILPQTMKDVPYRDPWGCVWETHIAGMVGSVTRRALPDWSCLDSFAPPDPGVTDGMMPMEQGPLLRYAEDCRARGALLAVSLAHGHTFLRLQDLRGFEALLLDMVDEEPRLRRLVSMVEDFNLGLIRRYVALEPDVVMIPEDLGTQTGPLVSPALFRRWIKPSYVRITAPVRERGIVLHQHSDGCVLDLIDDLAEVGGEVINLQDLVNGIDNLRAHVKGRLSIDLDIDRQEITVKGTPRDVDDHIRRCVLELGSREGGLSLWYQPWPPAPVENIRAVFDAMEKYRSWYS
jgi:uroporphyrinogen decarboxylase